MFFVINNILWKIKIVSPLDSMLRKPNGETALAVCDNFNKTILISREVLDKNEELMRQVLCHEIAHAAIFSYRLNLLNRQQQESVVNFISKHGQQIINITNENLYRLLNTNKYS